MLPTSSTETIALLAKISGSTDPFAVLSQTLNKNRHPTMNGFILGLLIAFGVTYALIFMLSCITLALPFILRHRKLSSSQHLWLWKRQYVPHVSTKYSYLVPNGGTAVMIAQIFGAILFEVYVFSSYLNFTRPEQDRTTYEFFWLAIAYTPGTIGFWFFGFGALYFRLSAPGLIKSRWPHPIIMNTLCFGLPILTVFGSAVFGILAHVTTTDQGNRYRYLQLILKRQSQFWNQSSPKDKAVTQRQMTNILKEPLEEFYRSVNRFIWQAQGACIFWIIIAAISVMFYCGTTSVFLMLMKRITDIKVGKRNLITLDHQFSSLSEELPSPTAKSGPKENNGLMRRREPSISEEAQRLQINYTFLTWHCGIIMLVLFWYVWTTLVLVLKMEQIVTETYWRGVSICLIVSSAVFLSISVMMQSWRVFLGEKTRGNA